MADLTPNHELVNFDRHIRWLNTRNWRWPCSGPVYHMWSDSLIWWDEFPFFGDQSAELMEVLSLLWHYRTGLMIGETREYHSLWEHCKQLFPRWVGFHRTRCEPKREYTVLYQREGTAALRDMEAIVYGDDAEQHILEDHRQTNSGEDRV